MIIKADELKTITLTEIASRMSQDPSLAGHPNRDVTLKNLPNGDVSLEARTMFGGGHRSEAADLLRAAAAREIGGSTASVVLKNASLDIAEKFKAGDVQTLNTGIENAKKLEALRETAKFNVEVREKQTQWADLRANGQPKNVQPGEAPGVAAILADNQTKVIISSSGANCPLILKSPLDPSGGTLLKPESGAATMVADVQSGMMADLAQKTGGLGFDVAKASAYTPTNADKKAIQDTITAMKADPALNPHKKQRLEIFEKRINALKTEEDLVGQPAVPLTEQRTSMTKMDYVNGTQLNQLPLADKVALFKDPAFAKELGRMAAMAPMMGLTDHMSVSSPDGGLTTNAGTSNPSNFMISADNGKLVPIDYASRFRSEAGEPDAIGIPNPDIAIMNLAKFVNSTDSATAAQQVLTDLYNDKAHTPLKSPMEMILVTKTDADAAGDDFFNYAESHVLKDPNIISDADKQAFVQNFIEGSKQGLDFIEQNIESFEAAYTQAAEKSGLDPDGQRHFMKKEELNNISMGLAAMKIDVTQAYKNFETQKNIQSGKVNLDQSQDALALPGPEGGDGQPKVAGGKDKEPRPGSVLDGLQAKEPKKKIKALEGDGIKVEKTGSSLGPLTSSQDSLSSSSHKVGG